MTKSSRLRIGFIGSGWTDRVQIPVFKLAGLTAQAINSAHIENAQRVAQKHAIPEVYATWQELIASPTVDLVSICSTPATHAEIAIAALRAGKHVICEKPTALNVAEAEAMLAAAQAAPDRLATIDHELRFDPARIRLRELIREGAIGTPLQIQLERLGSERLNPKTPWNWWCDVEQGGGMLGALGSHLFDQARWLLGRVEALTAQFQVAHVYRNDPASSTQRRVTADDHVHMLLRFVNGVQGQLTCSGMIPSGYGMNIRIIGGEGALWLDNQDKLRIMRGANYPGSEWEELDNQRSPDVMAQLATLTPGTATTSSLPASPLPVSPFTVGTYYLGKALQHALDSGDTGFGEAASFYDGLVVQRMIDAARRSVNEQNWMRL